MIRALYNLVLWAIQPLLRRKLRKRGQAEPGYLHAVEERFGHYTMARPQPEGGAPLVWMHAVSLGETRAAAILLAELRRQRPGLRLLLTHGTATGRADGAALLQPGDVQVWQPWDTRAAVRRFLHHFRPDVGVLMETEVWPNLIAECAAAGVPLALANARLSAKSLRGAERFGALMRPAYAALAAVWAQTEADAQRLRTIGAPVAGVFGNLKFDAQPAPALLAQGRTWRAAGQRPVLMLASSREGEELEFLKQIQALSQIQQVKYATDNEANDASNQATNKALNGVGQDIQWLIVPRHPQRFTEVAALVMGAGWTLSRRSAWGDGAPPMADVWLGDSLGEMAAYYALSDVALLGGSFAQLGGQNLIEAAACGCPVVMGPHTFNFAQAADLSQAAGAAQRVPDMAAGVAAARALLEDAAALQTMRAAALDFAQAHRGGAERTARAMLALAVPKP
ncbi:3-deoxy-D-manno-octulosonic acid transferase [Ottowia sp.]|uniref:3-deoxy-D-manno-octulosonic acid transferase n=1 Tax=Ottowia sp. TaxID=1898956 RepID=UPI003A84C9F7